MEDPVRVQGLINLIQCETETHPKAEIHSLRMEDNDVLSPNWLLLGWFSRDWPPLDDVPGTQPLGAVLRTKALYHLFGSSPLYSDDNIYIYIYIYKLCILRERKVFGLVEWLSIFTVHLDLVVVDYGSYSYLVLAPSLVCSFDYDDSYFMEYIYLMVY